MGILDSRQIQVHKFDAHECCTAGPADECQHNRGKRVMLDSPSARHIVYRIAANGVLNLNICFSFKVEAHNTAKNDG